MLHRIEISRVLRLGLETLDGTLLGFEGAALESESELRPSIWAQVIEAFQEQLLDHVCGARHRPLPRGRRAPFQCPSCRSDRGFRRRGYRSRQRVLLSRIGRLELRLAQVGCRCGRRFAPLLQSLGVPPGARLAPGLARRAVALATETSFAKAAEHLVIEAGAGPSIRTVKRLVRDAGRRCDLSRPRTDLPELPALLIDGTRVPAGPRHGRRARSARGVELNIACGVVGRDLSGRRPKAKVELVGATVGRPWSALKDAVGVCADAGIAVTDGDRAIANLLAAAVPNVPHQHCTFHIRHNVRLRLWQDGVPWTERDRVTDRLLSPVLSAVNYQGGLDALAGAISFADDNGWSHVAHHLRNVGPQLPTWQRVRRSHRAWRMPGRSSPEHTTSVLERTMREVNRRVDPPGNRWIIEGVRSMTNLLLGRRFDHPAWRDLWQDGGDVKTWAGLR